jgi:hypothetical protein
MQTQTSIHPFPRFSYGEFCGDTRPDAGSCAGFEWTTARCAGQTWPVNGRPREIGERMRLGPWVWAAGAGQLCLHDGVAAVGAHYDRHVCALARHRPERLHRIQAASVGLEREHAPVRAGECGAQRIEQPLADRAAREAEHRVRRSLGGVRRAPDKAGGSRFVYGDRSLRRACRQYAAQVVGVERPAGGCEVRAVRAPPRSRPGSPPPSRLATRWSASSRRCWSARRYPT